jgi:hypothetical protein
LSHVLDDRSFLSENLVQGTPDILNLRHVFPIRELWPPVKSFDSEKPPVSLVSFVAEVRDSLETSIIIVQQRRHLRVGSDVSIHVLHVRVSNTCDPGAGILQFRGCPIDLVRENAVIMLLNANVTAKMVIRTRTSAPAA